MIQESRITISAAEGLGEIGGNNLTRGNFPIGGLKLDLVSNGRLLRSILRMNLLKLRKEAKKFGGLFSVAGCLRRLRQADL